MTQHPAAGTSEHWTPELTRPPMTLVTAMAPVPLLPFKDGISPVSLVAESLFQSMLQACMLSGRGLRLRGSDFFCFCGER